MDAVQHWKLLVLIECICLFEWTDGRSISVIGDVHIDISDERIICDNIECPANTELCVVTKAKDPNDSTILVRSNVCYSEANEVLKNSVTKENVAANAYVGTRIEANRRGGITNVSNLNYPNNFDAEQFNKDMSEFQNNLNAQLENVDRQLEDLGAQLNKIFG